MFHVEDVLESEGNRNDLFSTGLFGEFWQRNELGNFSFHAQVVEAMSESKRFLHGGE